MMLQANHLSVTVGKNRILTDVSMALEEGQWLMLCGPNGAGKSTLVAALSRAIPCEGIVTLLERPLQSYRPKTLAQHVGVLSQNVGGMEAFTVEEVVAMGRYAYRRGIFGTEETDMPERVNAALQTVRMTEKRRQSMLTLSGGERQRALLAQALCQDPDVLMLDEPANHLDLVYQKQLFEVIDLWRRQPGKAVVTVVHDLCLARRWGTHALLLEAGKVIAQGKVQQVMDSPEVNRIWRMDVGKWVCELADPWMAKKAEKGLDSIR